MNLTENKLVVIIPAYEPQADFEAYAKELSSKVTHVLVVNDGSGPAYDEIFDHLTEIPNLICLKHEENRGKGCALKTAFAYCVGEFSRDTLLVTADCDGQHAIEDVLRVFAAACAHRDSLVLGSRDFTQPNIPRKSQVGNTMFRASYRWIYGLAVYDTQTGLRGFSVATAEEFLSVRGDRFEYEMGMLIYAKREEIPILEIPIQTIYQSPENRITHYRAMRDGMRIFRVVFMNAAKAGRHRKKRKKK